MVSNLNPTTASPRRSSQARVLDHLDHNCAEVTLHFSFAIPVVASEGHHSVPLSGTVIPKCIAARGYPCYPLPRSPCGAGCLPMKFVCAKRTAALRCRHLPLLGGFHAASHTAS